MTPRRVATGETGLPGGRAGPGVRRVGSEAFWSGRAGARSQPAGEHGSGEAHLRPPAGHGLRTWCFTALWALCSCPPPPLCRGARASGLLLGESWR